jgi:hypothetical protein
MPVFIYIYDLIMHYLSRIPCSPCVPVCSFQFQDPYVMAAVKGKILRRNGKKYEEIPGLN